MDEKIIVLILIVLEVSLWEVYCTTRGTTGDAVLILIVLEVSLWDNETYVRKENIPLS